LLYRLGSEEDLWRKLYFKRYEQLRVQKMASGVTDERLMMVNIAELSWKQMFLRSQREWKKE